MPTISIVQEERWPDYVALLETDEFHRTIEVNQATLDRWAAVRMAYEAVQHEMEAAYKSLYND